MAESLSWIDAGSAEHNLNDLDARLLEDYSGFGLLPVEMHTERGPFEDGEIFVGFVYRPRIVNLGLRLYQDTRSLLFDEHQTLLNAFNPSRGAGKLKKVLPDGTERRLDCRVVGGLDFNRDQMVGPAAQGVVIQLKAYSPFWYDPSQKSQSGDFNGATPVDVVCNNAGDVPVFPVITLEPTCQDPVITNVTTGKSITFSGYTIPGGKTVTIDCTLGNKTVKENGTNVIGYVTSTSVLFSLAKGNNTVRFVATAGNSGAFSISWYNQYLGV
jgi:hypothetical protein